MDEKTYDKPEWDGTEDVEIVDLDGKTHNKPGRVKPPRPQRSPLEPRFTPRQRSTQLTITAGIVAVTLLALVGSYAPTRDVLLQGGAARQPRPTATSAPALSLIYFDGSPSWGTLVVDGKAMTQLAPAAGYIALPLTPGKHTLTLHAEPFRFGTCTLSMPPNRRSDTCTINPLDQSERLASWLLSFPASLATLTQEARADLINVTQKTLDTQLMPVTVEPGESYAVNQTKRLEIAKQELKATLHLQLDTQASPNAVCTTVFSPVDSSCTVHSLDCHLFCPATDLLRPNSGSMTKAWDVLSVARPSWEYTKPDGTIVASGQPATGATSAYERLVPLHITWQDANWSVTPVFGGPAVPDRLKPQFDPACSSAMNEVQVNSTLNYIQHSHLGITWTYVSGQQNTAGCLGIATLNQGGSVNSTSQVASCLYRFGTFVAVNALAQQYWPSMPLADPYEQSIAQKLLAQYQSQAA